MMFCVIPILLVGLMIGEISCLEHPGKKTIPSNGSELLTRSKRGTRQECEKDLKDLETGYAVGCTTVWLGCGLATIFSFGLAGLPCAVASAGCAMVAIPMATQLKC